MVVDQIYPAVMLITFINSHEPPSCTIWETNAILFLVTNELNASRRIAQISIGLQIYISIKCSLKWAPQFTHLQTKNWLSFTTFIKPGYLSLLKLEPVPDTVRD